MRKCVFVERSLLDLFGTVLLYDEAEKKNVQLDTSDIPATDTGKYTIS